MNFNTLAATNQLILPLVSFIAFLFLLLLFYYLIKNISLIKKDIAKTQQKLIEEIRSSIQPKFIQATTETEDLMSHAVEIWRLDQRLNKAMGKMNENQKKSLENSMLKMKRYIEHYDIEVRDYTGQKYNSGLASVDVISVEKSSSVTEDSVKETVEPAILIKGQVVKKAKVIILSKK